MKIEWSINKKRGNIRPELNYSVLLEEHEKALAMPFLRIESEIPEPPDSWQEHCYPGQHERAGLPPKGFYALETPSHKGRIWKQSLRLPWREDNAYPEVERSFAKLREAFEAELQQAYDSQPMNETKSLLGTEMAKERIAPGVLAERLLKLADKSSNGDSLAFLSTPPF